MRTEAAFQAIGVYWRIGQPNPPRASHTHYTRREHLQRARYTTTTLALQERVAASIRKTWGVHTGRVLAFKNSDGTVNAEI